MLIGNFRCDILEDWKETVQGRGAWRWSMMEAPADLKDHMERLEKQSKDARKMRRDNCLLSESLPLKCEKAGCGFVGQTKARLVNHATQRHGRMARVMDCVHSVREVP